MSKLNKCETGILPYDKCLLYGPESLSDQELIAVILRSGTPSKNCLEVSTTLLDSFGELGILGLKHLYFNELKKIEGIGNVKAVMLMCISEISNRIYRANRGSSSNFSNSYDVSAYYMEDMRHLETEHFRLMMLDTKCNLIHESLLSMGTVNYTCFSARDIFRDALTYNSVYIIMVHNHPSGNPSPSNDDLRSTKVVLEAGRLVGIELIDHIIIGDNRYYSFKEHNLI